MRLFILAISLFFSSIVAASTVQRECQHILDARGQVIKNQESARIQNNHTNVSSRQRLQTSFPKNYQFVLFYRSTCLHCRRFDPVLKVYSMRTGIPVTAFTTDGVALPSFPKSVPLSRGVLNAFFGVDAQLAVPTLFIMNTHNRHVYPVSVGEMSYRDLSLRMNQLLPKIKRYEEAHHD